MTPAEIIARELADVQYGGLRDRDIEPIADRFIATLRAAGYDIVGSDEYHERSVAHGLERAAKVAEAEAAQSPNSVIIPTVAAHIATAIRALADGGRSE